MKLVIQRVLQASVTVDGKVVGEIGEGALVLIGITHTDTEEKSSWLASKLLHLRMFEDEHGKTNQSISDVYRNNLNNREFGKEVPEVFRAGRETIAGGKARARDEKTEAKPTPPKTDCSGCFGIKGSLLVISQFTLYADCSEGRRPSFTKAAPPEIAKPLYEHFVKEVQKGGLPVKTGIFGAKMEVSLVNHGPVTLIVSRD